MIGSIIMTSILITTDMITKDLPTFVMMREGMVVVREREAEGVTITRATLTNNLSHWGVRKLPKINT
jgi:hypothetical protein